MDIKIVLADDHPLFRKGLRLIFEEEQDMRVVGEAGNGQEAIDLVRKLAPDVVVMDITMPDLNGIEATRQIQSESPATKVLALSIHAGRQFVQDMLAAGAAGYILKDSAPEELPRGIRRVMQGGVFLSSAITTVVVSEYKDLLSQKEGSGEKSADRHAAGTKNAVAVNKTKLYRPPNPEEAVHRQRLIDKLDRNLLQPFTLVVAPAGYGKSTLISQWLASSEIAGAWVSLDENDNDFRTFVAYLLTAVQFIHPGAGQDIWAMLSHTELPVLRTLSLSLINELAELDDRFILVLDDYHVIQEKAVHDLLTELLKYAPRTVHLVLTSRIDPPLPLASLRARGEMNEIRAQDLRFSLEETSEYLQKMMGRKMEDSSVALLGRKTEGWITGLRLAALSLSHRKDLDSVLSELPDDNRYVMDYMVAEVLSQLPTGRLTYLLKTSILDRFSAPLCQAVCAGATGREAEGPPGHEFLDWLLQANLFLIPLDDEHRWFRYHHLFQELLLHHLKRRLSSDEIDTLHRRAGTWFAGQGLIEEALHHYLAAGDTRAAVRLIAKHRHDVLNLEQWSRLDRWLKLLPPGDLDKHPEVLISKAWICEISVRLADMEAFLKKFDALDSTATSGSETEWEALVAEISALKAFQLYLKGDGRGAVSLAKAALENLDPQAFSVQGFSQVIMAGGYQMKGELKQAYKVVHEALKRELPHGPIYHSRLYMALCFVHWIAANLTGMRQGAQQLLKLGQDANFPQSIATSHYFLGVFHYLRNELNAAESQLNLAIEDRYKAITLNFSHSTFVLALCLQAQNRPEGAREIVENLIAHALELHNSELLTIAQAFQAELALRQGNIPKAEQWVRNYDPHPFNPGYRYYLPQLTLVKVHMALDSTRNLMQADVLLARLHAYYRSIHNDSLQIETLALMALLDDARSDEAAAFEKLADALRLAEPDKIMRPFLDLGLKMADLLNRLTNQDSFLKFGGMLLKAFRNELAAAARSDAGLGPSSEQPAHDSAQLESLSKRELEVMSLLARRMSNQEIAEKLFLSSKTVKAHLYNIYQKLNVNSRRQAVEKARALGIV